MIEPRKRIEPPIDEPWRPRFGIGGMMLVMLVFSMMAASAFYLVQALRLGGSYRLAFIAVTLITPLLLMVALSLGVRWMAYQQRRERRRRKKQLLD
jgi:small-conductance mechanosensitive channel